MTQNEGTPDPMLLGIEPADRALDPPNLCGFPGPETLAVDVLLDQRVAAGLGNVYKSEVLFVERAHPQTRLEDLARSSLTRLYQTGHELLKQNLAAGARVTREAAPGEDRVWVYGRSGDPCYRCGHSIRYERLGETLRSTYWCDSCQPAPGEIRVDRRKIRNGESR